MQTPDMGSFSAALMPIEALKTHSCRLRMIWYQSLGAWHIVCPRNTQVSLTSESGLTVCVVNKSPINSDRRLRCRRASKHWLQWVSLRRSLLAQHPKKNLSSSSPSPSRSSPSSQASSSNTFTGQAFAPVLNLPRLRHHIRVAPC